MEPTDIRVWMPDESCHPWQVNSALIGSAVSVSLGSFRVPPGLEGVLATVSGGGPKGTTISDKFRDRLELREDLPELLESMGKPLRTRGNLIAVEEIGDFNSDALDLPGICSLRVNSALLPVFASLQQNRTYHLWTGPALFWTTVALQGWMWESGSRRVAFHRNPELRYWKPDSSCLPFLFTTSNNLAQVGTFGLPHGINGVIRAVELSGNTTFLQKSNGRLWISRMNPADVLLATPPEEAAAVDLTGAIGEVTELNNAGTNVPGFALAIRMDTLPFMLKLHGGITYAVGRGQVGTNCEIALFGWTWPEREDWID